MTRGRARSLAAAFLVALARAAAGQEAGENVTKRGEYAEDLYLAGGRVDVDAAVQGDVVAAGGNVLLDGRISEDVLAVGGTIDVRGQVSGDVRGVGGQVSLSANVREEAALAGGSVRIPRGAAIGGRAFLAGENVIMDGRVGRDLWAAGGEMAVGGEVAGDVRIAAGGRVVIGEGARIGGDLVYRSPEPAQIAPGARIGGRAIRTSAASSRGFFPGLAVFGFLLWTAGLALAGIVYLFLWPGFSLRAARLVSAEPARSLGLGLAILFIVPLTTVFLLVTIVGAPVGLAAGALYAVALLAGYLTAALWLADLLARRTAGGTRAASARLVLFMVAAVVAVALVGLIPFLGALVSFAALVFGLGALSLAIVRAWREERLGAAPPPGGAAGPHPGALAPP